jgi:hypothetical protein
MNRLTILAAVFMSAAAVSATAQPTEAIYGNELERCVAAVRADISEDSTRQIRHFVTEVEKKGAWYEFAIRSELYDEVDGALVKEVSSRCRAHRWVAETQLEA